MNPTLLPLAALLALSACERAPAPPAAEDGAARAVEADQAAIPAALHGRWGLTENDCDPAQADAAKGLIEVSATTIKFYESLATLGEVTESSESAIEADFAFTGEGMEWSRRMTLTADGDTMVREDRDADAEFAALTYSRCAG